MPDETEVECEHLNITFTNKAGKLTLLKRYKVFYKIREIRFHFRFPEPNKLCDNEKAPYPNMVFWQILEDLQVPNAHIYLEPTKHIIYVHHDRHFFRDLVDDCVAANADNPEYRFERAEFERMMLENFVNFKNNDDFYYSPVTSPRTSSPPTLDYN